MPDSKSLIIIAVDSNPQLVHWQLQHLRQKLPGKGDSTLFKIVTKGKIAQHLEKCMMACGVTDVFQVVVFAPSAHTLLRARRPHVLALFPPEEHVLKLHHAGVAKQECGVILGDER